MSEDTGATAGKKGVKLARMDLIPPYPLWLLAEVYGKGAEKYADRNWEKGIELEKSYGAMMRHAVAWQAGEDIDPEGQHHLASVAWHAFAILELLRTHPELDNRPHVVLEQEPQSLTSEVTNQAEIDAAKAEVEQQLWESPVIRSSQLVESDDPTLTSSPFHPSGTPEALDDARDAIHIRRASEPPFNGRQTMFEETRS